MSNWNIHWLEAEGSLKPWHVLIAAEIAAAEVAVTKLIEPPCIDILIALRKDQMIIPELGIGGFAYTPSLFAISCNPTNENFIGSLSNGAFLRQTLHETHHCLRMSGPGYGHTLGEALISEGLAGRFVSHLVGSPPEIWEKIADSAEIASYLPDTELLASENYDHSGWLFGTGSMPRWLGYSLGYEIVGGWLSRHEPTEAIGWFETSASEIIANSGLVEH